MKCIQTHATQAHTPTPQPHTTHLASWLHLFQDALQESPVQTRVHYPHQPAQVQENRLAVEAAREPKLPDYGLQTALSNEFGRTKTGTGTGTGRQHQHQEV